MAPSGHDQQGFPPEAARIPNADIGREGWNIHRDFETPFASIDNDRMRSNSLSMQQWARSHGVELWPHAKTVMSPELVRLQLGDGAAGMTAATTAQLRRLREWGVTSAMLANQLVQDSAMKWVAAERRDNPDLELWSFVDSVSGVELLDAIAESTGTTLEVLLEIGVAGGRTGVRSRQTLLDVVRALRAAPRVRMLGVAAYEGVLAADRSANSLETVDAYLETVVDAFHVLLSEGILPTKGAVFTAGGSMFFDRVTAAASALPSSTRTIIRAGCTLLHDHGLYARSNPFSDPDLHGALLPALTVWGTIHSQPEPGRAYADIGRRDASADQGLPVALRHLARGRTEPHDLTGVRVIALNDQHAHLEVDPNSRISIGDRIEFGISHPCTTMDKWRRIPLTDPVGNVVGAISTEF